MTVRFLKDDYAGKKGAIRSDLKPEEERLLVAIGTVEVVAADAESPPAEGYDRRDMQPKPRARRTRAKQAD